MFRRIICSLKYKNKNLYNSVIVKRREREFALKFTTLQSKFSHLVTKIQNYIKVKFLSKRGMNSNEKRTKINERNQSCKRNKRKCKKD